MTHGVEDGLAGDCVEDDAFDRLLGKRLAGAQHLEDVPGDRLALAVWVSREDDAVGVLDRLDDVGEPLAGLGVDLPAHREILVRADRAVLRRQVADMPVGGQDLVVRTEIFVDGLGFRRGFDDDDIHWLPKFGGGFETALSRESRAHAPEPRAIPRIGGETCLESAARVKWVFR
jgi:hypothetical protein